jgi:predicted amino acid-binding ACT domain protein
VRTRSPEAVTTSIAVTSVGSSPVSRIGHGVPARDRRAATPDTDTANTSNTDSGWDGDRPKNGSGLTNEQRVQLAGSHLDDLDMSSREAFQNDFVERLNNSSELRGTFYRSYGHRWSASDTIGTERYEIPKVVWDSENGRWERTPEAEPPGYLGGPTDVRLNSPDADLPEGLREALSELDGLAEQRRVSIDAAGIAARSFTALADANINVDMIVQNVADDGTTDISFTLPTDDGPRALDILEGLRGAVGIEGIDFDEHIGKVSLVGAGMKTHPGIAASMFTALSDAGVNIEMISTSTIRISVVVRQEDVEGAVRAVHERFGLGAEVEA